MSVVIAGAGSVGLLLGSFLAESGIEVTMFVRREEQATLLMSDGIRRINENGTESVYRVNATTDIKDVPVNRLWIIAVKYSNVKALLMELENAGREESLMFIQNGIGHIAHASATQSSNLAFATVEHGALRTDDRTVVHNGIGMLTIGAGRGNAHEFNIVEQAKSKSFPVTRHEDAEFVLMRKVLINCMINPLTAILEVKNGELLSNDSCYVLFERLYKELMNAFPEMHTELSLENVIAVCKRTAENHSSMLSDRSAGRPMEIETIVTAVIRKAREAQKEMPLLSTFEEMLYAIEKKAKTQ